MIDFDQSGQYTGHKVRAWLGPSLGWQDVQVKPTRFITSVGVFPILPGDGVILANVAGAVTLLLPDVRVWVSENAFQPATAFERSISIKDLGGNAASFPITVIPFGSQTLDLQSSFQILQARQLLRLYPRELELTGWYSG